MRKLISILSFIALLGQVGNLELGQVVTGTVLIKLLVLLIVFAVSSRNIKIK